MKDLSWKGSLAEGEAHYFTGVMYQSSDRVVNRHLFARLVREAYNTIMEITVKLPDDLAQRQNPGREALEALVIEGYRSGALSHYQASQFLGLSRFQFDGFLKQRNIHEHAYSVEDLDQDEETLRQLQSKGLL
jgi:predicted HTH domain antitoxin